MPNHLFFITSVNEAKIAISGIKKLKKEKIHFTIVSSDPFAGIFLKTQGVEFSDIGNYYPVSRRVITAKKQLRLLMKKWNSDHRIHKSLLYKNQFQLNRLIGYSLNTYLAEVLHSLMTAEEILKKTKPDVVHVSPRWLESPFRRYQSERLNLENIALFHLAKQHCLRILTFKIPLSQTISVYTISFLLTLIWQSLHTSYYQIFHSARTIKSNKLIIMANYYQLENFIPVIKELKKQNRQFTVIGKISSEQTKRLANLIPAFISLETLEKQNKIIWHTRLAKTTKYCLKLIALLPYLRRFFLIKNQNYWQFMAPKFFYYFTAEFPLLTDYLEGATQLFKGGTRLLATPATTDNVSQTIAIAAKSENTTVLEFQHGNTFNEDDDYLFWANDYFAVWGPEVRSIIVKNQSSKQLPITGYPYFDRYRHSIPMTISAFSVRQKLGISKNTKVLLILSVFPSGITRLSPNESPHQFMEIIFNTIAGLNEKWKIIFRPHPSVGSPWVVPLAKNFKLDLYYDFRGLKLEEVIAASNVIVSNFSTTTIDAMFQQKPILLYDFPDINGVYKYSNWFIVSSGAVEIFKTQEQLTRLILNSLYNQQFKKRMLNQQKLFLKKYCSIHLRPATDRAVFLINKLIKNNKLNATV